MTSPKLTTAAVAIGAMCVACSTGSSKPPRIAVFIAVEAIQGLDQTNTWYAGVDGHVADAAWQPNGPTPTAGNCIAWSQTSDGDPVSLPPATISLVGVGTMPLVAYQNGSIDLGSGALPAAPFMNPGDGVSLSLSIMNKSGSVSSDVPKAPVLVGPAAGSPLTLNSPMHFEWTPQGEDHVLLILSLFSGSYAFLGAVNCNVPDTGTYDMPAFPSPIPGGASIARLSIRTEHHQQKVIEDTQADLFVRQFFNRDFQAVPN